MVNLIFYHIILHENQNWEIQFIAVGLIRIFPYFESMHLTEF